MPNRERMIFYLQFHFDSRGQVFPSIAGRFDGEEVPMELSRLSMFVHQNKGRLQKNDLEFCYSLGSLLKKVALGRKVLLAINNEKNIIKLFKEMAKYQVNMQWRNGQQLMRVQYNPALPFDIRLFGNKNTLNVELLKKNFGYDKKFQWMLFLHDDTCMVFSNGKVYPKLPMDWSNFLQDFVENRRLSFNKKQAARFIEDIYNRFEKRASWNVQVDFELYLPTKVRPKPLLRLNYEFKTLQPVLSFLYKGQEIPPTFDGKVVKDKMTKEEYKRNFDEEMRHQNYLMDLFTKFNLPFMLQAPGDIAKFMGELVPKLNERKWKIESNVPEFNVHPGSVDLEFMIKASGEGSGQNWFDFEPKIDVNGEAFSLPEIARLMVENQGYVKTSSGYVKLSEDSRDSIEFLSNSGALQSGKKFNKADLLPLLTVVKTSGTDSASQDFIAQAQRITEVGYCDVTKDFVGTLRDYQQYGVNWIHFLASNGFGGILADDMGLGKTIQAIAFTTQLEDKRPILVIGPTNVIYNWQREISTFAPDRTSVVYAGPGREKALKDCPNPNYLITTYGIVKNDLDFLKGVPFSAIIVDEAQAIKNSNTQISKAIKKLNGEFKLILTGTPIENHFGDLWNLFDFIMPGFLGNQKSFDLAVNSDKQKALLKARIRPFVLRREKGEVLDELPEKTEITLKCPMNDTQKKLYKTVLDAAKKGLMTSAGKRDRLAVLTALLKLRQVCLHPALLPEFKGQGLESAKFDLATEKITDILDEGHKIVLFSQFTQMLDIMQNWAEKQDISFKRIDGSVASKKRQDIVEDFQATPTPTLMMISLKAGGMGINLTSADYVMHMDPWWNPAIEAQATDRVHRMGQKNKVIVYKFITEGTVEEKIQDLQEEKKSLLSQIIDIDSVQEKSVDVDELREVLLG
jgi:superfamily II DNA or RNA helicase